MDLVLTAVHYLQFQSLDTPNSKIKYLIKNKDQLENNYDIKVDNLIWAWEKLVPVSERESLYRGGSY